MKEVFEGKDFFLQKNTFFEFDSVWLNNERTRNSCSTKAIREIYILCPVISDPISPFYCNLGLRVLFSTAIQHTVNTPFPRQIDPPPFHLSSLRSDLKRREIQRHSKKRDNQRRQLPHRTIQPTILCQYQRFGVISSMELQKSTKTNHIFNKKATNK